MKWSEEERERVKKLWRRGVSASEIGKELGRSRNAVVGMAHRSLGTFMTPRRSKRPSKPKAPKPIAVEPELPPPPLPAATTESIHLLDLQWYHCKDYQGSRLYCGKLTVNNSSWCEAHYAKYIQHRRS